jgi:hypothetical protein
MLITNARLFILVVVVIVMALAVGAAADRPMVREACGGFLEDEESGEAISVVPLVALLANPTKYDGCLVHTVGVLGVASTALFSSSEQSEANVALNGIGLVASKTDLSRHAGRWIVVRGRFAVSGPFSVGVITELTKVSPVPNTPAEKRAETGATHP